MAGSVKAALKNHQVAILLGLITLVGLVLRISSMNDSLVWDEVSTHYVTVGRNFGGMLDMVRGEQEVSPPLYFIVA
jgi:hypothetical protein